MKKLILFTFLILNAYFSFSQYHVTDQGTVTASSGTLDLGTYTSGQTYEFTLCSDNPLCSQLVVYFNSYSLGTGTLCVYDGPSSASPLIGCNHSGSSQAVISSPSNATGCLTFTWTDAGTGGSFSAAISCQFMCQGVLSNIVSTNPSAVLDTSGIYYIDVCDNVPITFNGSGIYQNITYPQSDATSTFDWLVSDGTSYTGQSFTNTFAPGGYSVFLNVADAQGCSNTNQIEYRIRVSQPPTFAGTMLSPDTICQGDTVFLSGQVYSPVWTSQPPISYADTTFLPDGSGVSYTTSISVAGFNPGQTLTNANDIVGICLNMEHSFLGDLTMFIQCPTGQTVQLEAQGGGGVFLGDANDSGTGPGVGWDYCFNANPVYGTLQAEATAGNTVPVSQGNALPPGTYASYQSLNGLVGCDLNGTWTITIMDNWSIDDGYIFSWWIEFASYLYPSVWQYQNTYPVQTWSTNTANGGSVFGSMGIGLGSGTYITNLSANTNQPFYFSVTDDFGCTYDTTIYVTVLADTSSRCCVKPDVNIVTQNQSVCTNTIQLNAGMLSHVLNTGRWEYTGPGIATFTPDNTVLNPTVTVDQYGSYDFSWIETNFSPTCSDTGTVTIQFIEQPVANAGNGANLCLHSYQLNAIASVGMGTWTFSPSTGASVSDIHDAGATFTVINDGAYNLIWTEDNNGCVDAQQITVILTNQPIANAGSDTTLCQLAHSLNAVSSYGTGTWTYNGAGVATFSDAHAPNSNVSVSATGIYQFIWTEDNGNGCVDADTIQVSLTQTPTSTFTVSQINCFGQNSIITYTGTGNSLCSYSWDFAGGTAIPGIGAGPHTLSWSTAGDYTITLEVSLNGCTNGAVSLTVTQPSKLTTNIVSTDILCHGETNGTADLTVAGGTLPYFIHWSNNSTQEDQQNLGSGVYSVTVTDANSCSSTNGLTINEPPRLSIYLTPTQIICENGSAILNIFASGGTAPYSYYWNGVLSSTSSSTFSPSVTTSYSAYIIDANNCVSGTANTAIHVAPPVHVEANINVDTICPGDPVLVSVDISGGAGPPYFIINEQGMVVSPPYIMYPTVTGDYSVSVQDACATQDFATFHVTVLDPPPASFFADSLEGCQPFTVNFVETTPNMGQNYLWDFGDNENLSLAKNPVHTYKVAGLFDVTLTVTSVDGCKTELTIPAMVNVHPKPLAGFVWGPEYATVVKPILDFTNLTTYGSQYIWTFGDGDSSSLANPYHRFPAAGTYSVQLIAISPYGCLDTTMASVSIQDEYSFYAPTAFSPDNDGVNDVFFVSGHGIDPANFYLAVYDRWGNILFETKDYNEIFPAQYGWDGRGNNNEIVSIGVYTWFTVFKDFKGNEHEFAGSVSVVK